MNYEKFNIDKDYQHIYYFLKDQGFSEIFISSLRKEKGLILKNKEIINTKTYLRKGDILEIDLNTKTKSLFKTNQNPINIIYEDNYLLIVNKPSGLSSSPSKSHYDDNLASSILGYMQPKNPNFVLRMINRLDKDTAGIIIIAKDILTYSQMKDIKKNYYAICEGIIDNPLILDFPIETITKDGINQIKRIISSKGKSAKTFITPIKTFQHMTLLKIHLENGRTHQIRVHLSHIGHPLIGDSLYGEISKEINHSALICKQITFIHPKTKQEMNLEIDFPKDFSKLLTN